MTSPQNDQNLLLSSLKKGDNKAFVRIYNLYWESLYAIGYNRLKSQSDVEDIIQELFTDLWNKRKSIQVRGSLKMYLYTAMKYKVIDHLRKRKLQYTNLDDIKPGLSLYNESPEKILSLNELYDQLKKGVDQLPDHCKVVFKMSRDLNMTAAEIANELKLSKRTVETRIYKSLKHLRSNLSDYTTILLLILIGLI
ncbi:MAG: RNA polymerase sigma-70 factor [Cyclobacteriaceae bacterium]|nr:RNA polymerase sigma-70 factor [Cyclobacteriaceae bacterium SS2]